MKYLSRWLLVLCGIRKNKNCVNYKSDRNQLSITYCEIVDFIQTWMFSVIVN